MSAALAKSSAHVVDILGNVKGRDQPIMLFKKATELVSKLNKELFLDDDVVFFDPFCKAGEILLSCAYLTAKYHSVDEGKIFDVEKIQNELYGAGRYFALAPDERHHKISLRTFLGNENSHKPEYTHIIRNGNYLSEEDGTLNKEKFKTEFESMIEYIKKTTGKKRIVAIGNPPYQEEDGGAQKSAKPIYQFFVQALIDHKDISEFVLVIPARWFGGGKGLDGFRKSMMDSKQIKSLTYFEKSGAIFPTVDIDGGICFVHWQETHNGLPELKSNGNSKEVDLSKYDIIPDDPLSIELINKIQTGYRRFVGQVAWPRKPFGLSTDYFRKKTETIKKGRNTVPCLTNNKEIKHAMLADVSQKSKFAIPLWKVCVPGAYGGKKGARRKTLPPNQVFLVEPNVIVTETYMVVHVFEEKSLAENFQAYLQTDFARYFLGLRKITQHIPKDRWNWVPLMDFRRKWTDKELNKFFELSLEEQEHIKNKVKEWS